MKNNTILNMFVREEHLEDVVSLLVDYPVVVKKIGSVYRVQLSCYYVGFKGHLIEINYYDQIERDYYYIKINSLWLLRVSAFAKELSPDDFEEYDSINDGK